MTNTERPSATDGEVTTANTRVKAVELAASSGMFALKTMALSFAKILDEAALSETGQAEQLEIAKGAIKAMAEDGWLWHGEEGMSESQQACYDAYKKLGLKEFPDMVPATLKTTGGDPVGGASRPAEAGSTPAASQPIVPCVGGTPQWTPVEAQRLLDFRNAYATDEHDSAYNAIYWLVSKRAADPFHPWAEVEAAAKRDGERPEKK